MPKKKRRHRKPQPTGLDISPKEDYTEYQRQYFKKIRQPRDWREGITRKGMRGKSRKRKEKEK